MSVKCVCHESNNKLPIIFSNLTVTLYITLRCTFSEKFFKGMMALQDG